MSGGLITAFSDAGGGQVTVTSNGHGLVTLATVFIEDTTSYNGFFEISNVTTNTYEITDTFVSNDATGRYTTDTSNNDVATSNAQSMTSGGTTGTKGSWVHLFTTSEEINWINITLDPFGETDQSCEIDIGTGLDSSEVVQLTFPAFINIRGVDVVLPPVPIKIAAGIEVKARFSASGANQTIKIDVRGLPESDYGTSTINEGIGIGTRQGTDVDPGSTDNAKGSYTQLSASTSSEVNYLLVCLANSSNNSQTNQDVLVDIAIGASSSEINIISNGRFLSSSNENSSGFFGIFETIPSGSRVTARAQSSNTLDANDRIIDVAIVGFNITAPSGGSGGTPKLINGGLAR